MTPAAFKRSLSNAVPPKAVNAALQGLWWAKKGDWDKAHRLIMAEHSSEAAWVHAYLHRVEGDEGNAFYWYRQARRAPAEGPDRGRMGRDCGRANGWSGPVLAPSFQTVAAKF